MEQISINKVIENAKRKNDIEKFVTISCKVHESDAKLFTSLSNKQGLKPSKILNSFIYEFIETFIRTEQIIQKK